MLTVTSSAFEMWRVWQREERLPPEERTRGERLRDVLSSLGPVFVKCGQTLAQRPDLVGAEAAQALGTLQMENAPFDSSHAWAIIREDLGWDGHIAPALLLEGLGNGKEEGEEGEEGGGGGEEKNGERDLSSSSSAFLFREISTEPVAAASLGQVYRAVTHEGVELAIKVQRPNIFPLVAKDLYILKLTLELVRRVWKSPLNLGQIADEVGRGVFKEVDYHLEAANAEEFSRKHAFLGFVRAPKFYPEYSGPRGTARVLAMEWIEGKPLSALERAEQMHMVTMAVDATVAQLIRTGLVHADPHEGNLLYTQDGELCFLDFGLMARVEKNIMEAFASGVCHVLAGDWRALSYDLQEIGIVADEGFQRRLEDGSSEPAQVEDFAEALKLALVSENDGTKRFGALAPGLRALSRKYKLQTPPYIVLLCRTFLTLEGLADRVDPDFSVYTASLPYAVRRSLSPETSKGETALREALLTAEGEFRWERLTEILERAQKFSGGHGEGTTEEQGATGVAKAAETRLVAASSHGSRHASGDAGATTEPPTSASGTIAGLLGSTEGAALRRVTRDADSFKLAEHLASDAGRPLRRAGAGSLARMTAAAETSGGGQGATAAKAEPDRSSSSSSGEEGAAAKAERVREREQRWSARALRVLALTHLRRLVNGGVRGWLTLTALAVVAAKMVGRAWVLIAKTWVADALLKLTKKEAEEVKKTVSARAR